MLVSVDSLRSLPATKTNSCSACSIVATVPRTDRSFRMRKPPTRFPHRTPVRNLNLRTARLERFALLVSVDSFGSLPATKTNSCSATSIFALLAWSASHCSFRLTHSPRFRLRRMPHWGTSRFVPPATAAGSFFDQGVRSRYSGTKKRITVKVIRFLWSIGDSNS